LTMRFKGFHYNSHKVSNKRNFFDREDSRKLANEMRDDSGKARRGGKKSFFR